MSPLFRRHRVAPLLVLLLLCAGLWYVGPAGHIRTGASPGEDAAARPCDAPIGWKVGFVDARFGIAGVEVRSAIEEAITLWEGAAGRKLFAHSPVGGMPVDLQYDDRQRRLDEKAKEERRLADWQAELSRRPRSPAEVARYNRLVDRYNAALNEYQSRPVLHFQVAEYSHSVEPRTGRIGKRRITVWAVDSRAGLVSALAHELGHALGIGHVSDPSALMTSEGEGSQDARAALLPADLEELTRVCGAESGEIRRGRRERP